MAEFASKGVAGSGLGLGIAGTALGVLNGGLGNLLGGIMGNGCNNGWNNGWNNGCNGGFIPVCSENMTVNRYELGQEAKISELQSQIALRDANTYNDQKLLEVYKYFDGKIEGINSRLCDQAVWNATQTATISCMAQQIAALNGLTKLVVPNTSVCPGWGNVTITPAAAPTTAG
jgi:hypothetical protein